MTKPIEEQMIWCKSKVKKHLQINAEQPEWLKQEKKQTARLTKCSADSFPKYFAYPLKTVVVFVRYRFVEPIGFVLKKRFNKTPDAQ